MAYPKKKKKTRENLAPYEEKVYADLELFEQFQRTVIPELRNMVVDSGTSERDIYKYAKKFAAARVVSVVVTEKDNHKALTAAKDILDRANGKATETRKIKHEYEDIPDEQLNALLESELNNVSNMEEDNKKVQ